MIKPEQIPAAVVDAAIDAMLKADDYYVCGNQARAAIAAAINAWPKAYLSPDHIDPQQIRLTLEKADG